MSTKISIINQKGGVGKSSLAYNMAHNFAAKYPVLLVDSDSQASIAARVAQRRHPLPFTFSQKLEDAWDGSHVLNFIDTPGHLTNLPLVRQIIKNSDMVVVPTSHSTTDVDSAISVLELAQELDTPVVMVMVRVNPQTMFYGYTKRMLDSNPMAVPVLKNYIREAEVWVKSFSNGYSVLEKQGGNARERGKAIADLRAVAAELIEVYAKYDTITQELRDLRQRRDEVLPVLNLTI